MNGIITEEPPPINLAYRDLSYIEHWNSRSKSCPNPKFTRKEKARLPSRETPTDLSNLFPALLIEH